MRMTTSPSELIRTVHLRSRYSRWGRCQAQGGTVVTEARIETVVDTLYGRELPDPYRWMEDDGPELRDWLLAQGKAAEEHFAALPLRAELKARLDELTADAVEITGFALAGDR